MKTKQVKAIVIACNTASACALDALEPELDIPIIGVIKSGARAAAEVTKNGRIGVIGTTSTIESGMYTKYLHSLDPSFQVFGKACPLLCPLVEEGLTHDFVTEEIAGRYLKDLQYKAIDSLILGCTHYPLLRTMLTRMVGNEMTLVNPAYETAIELKELLEEKHLSCDSNVKNAGEKYEFYVSDAAEKFKEFANSILPYDIERTREINIEEF